MTEEYIPLILFTSPTKLRRSHSIPSRPQNHYKALQGDTWAQKKIASNGGLKSIEEERPESRTIYSVYQAKLCYRPY